MGHRLTADARKEWVRQLRSGELEQGTGVLARKGLDGGPDELCCLGVYACHVAPDDFRLDWSNDVLRIEWEEDDGHTNADENYLPIQAEGTPISFEVQHFLASLNDGCWSFSDIAEVIKLIDLRRTPQLINGDKFTQLVEDRFPVGRGSEDSYHRNSARREAASRAQEIYGNALFSA